MRAENYATDLLGDLRRREYIHHFFERPERLKRNIDRLDDLNRLPCICRQSALGSEQRYCYGLSLEPGDDTEMGKILRSISADYLNGPDVAVLEVVPKGLALEQIRSLEKEQMIHSVWTFMTPFIGGICNCDLNCMAIQACGKNFPVMFRAEYLAEVDQNLCNGCKACLRTCHFDALKYDLQNEKASIDWSKCYGCGICRESCKQEAISLKT